MIKISLTIGEPQTEEFYVAIKKALVGCRIVKPLRYNAPTVRYIKQDARKRGFDLKLVKSKAGTPQVSHIMFKNEADYVQFLLKWKT